jgi:peptidoglycan/xylan/chitin deacetylase (PgdA/CDA1 family)
MGPSPTPRGALVISLDFELHWGVRDKLAVADYRQNLLGVRRAVPAMLELFTEFGIHATWATVGFLFFDGKRELLEALPARRPAYARRELSPYEALDGVGENERDDPFHFAPSLIRRIADTPHQEVGTHTLSHYYCLEAGQEGADFRADLEAAVAVTRAKLGREPESIVFPRNQVSPGYLGICGELGLMAYRGNHTAWMYRARPEADESVVRRGLRLLDAYVPLAGRRPESPPTGAAAIPVNVPANRYLRPSSLATRRLAPLRLRRITTDLRHAADDGRLFHLWWHPHDFGLHLEENLAVLRRILGCFAGLRERCGMESLTMAEAARRALVMHAGGELPPLGSRPAAGGCRGYRADTTVPSGWPAVNR